MTLQEQLRFGPHRVQACADIRNQVRESNESNNCLTETFYGGPGVGDIEIRNV